MARYLEAIYPFWMGKQYNPADKYTQPILPGPDILLPKNEHSIFLAGGISGCTNWQQDVSKVLGRGNEDTLPNLVIFNPRRDDFPIDDPDAAHEQIEWEEHALRYVDAIMFWFTDATLQPIAMFELGRWSVQKKPLFVGRHPDYERRQDIDIQMSLVRPNMPVRNNLMDMVSDIKKWSDNESSRPQWEPRTVANGPLRRTWPPF